MISVHACRWTHIPVAKLLQSEREKLLGLEDILHKSVIGAPRLYCRYFLYLTPNK